MFFVHHIITNKIIFPTYFILFHLFGGLRTLQTDQNELLHLSRNSNESVNRDLVLFAYSQKLQLGWWNNRLTGFRILFVSAAKFVAV